MPMPKADTVQINYFKVQKLSDLFALVVEYTRFSGTCAKTHADTLK